MPNVPREGDVERLLSSVPSVATVVLVEGESDRAAVETIARRLGVDLEARSVAVVAMGGVTNIGRFVAALGPSGRGLAVTGLCDANEAPIVARALRRHGIDVGEEVAALAAVGFFVCHRDLEDELIRAAGVDGAERMLAAEGELDSFRRFQQQPAQREVAVNAQLRRFFGTRSTRKLRAATALARAIDLDAVPPPLAALVSFVSSQR